MGHTRPSWTEVRIKPGHHTYIDDRGRLIAEWYDFGDNAPYESANQLIFDQREQARISELLGANTADLARIVAERFATKWEVEDWAKQQGIAFERKVDFMP